MERKGILEIRSSGPKSLMLAIKENDLVFLRELYLSNFDKFRSFALPKNGKENRIQTVYQDAFAVMVRDVKEDLFITEDLNQLREFLFQIAKFKFLAYRKKIRYKNTIFINRELEAEERSEAEEVLDSKITQIMSALEKLELPCQTMFGLYYFESLSFADISKKLDVSEVLIHTEKYRCHQVIFKHLSFLPELPPQTEQQIIDDYLLGRSEKRELAQLERKLMFSPSFLEELEEQRILLLGVQEFFLRKRLVDFHKDVVQYPSSNFKKKAWVAFFISVLILIIVILWAVFYTRPSSEELFNSNFEPRPGLEIPMENANDDRFYRGMKNYNNGQYSRAVFIWEPLYAHQPENDTILFYLGVANLAVDNTRQASKYLLLAQENVKSVFHADAQYYYALSLIKQNRIKEAKRLLEHRSCNKCETLLEKLRQL